jgi:hypothetical protein
VYKGQKFRPALGQDHSRRKKVENTMYHSQLAFSFGVL